MSALASKADMCSAQAHVCFGSRADICGAPVHVCFGLGPTGGETMALPVLLSDVALRFFGQAVDISATARIENEEAAGFAHARDAEFISHRAAAATCSVCWLHPFKLTPDGLSDY